MGLITETETYGLNRMTKKAIIDSCKKNKLYITPHLNDVLYLHFQGYQKIEDLDEYTGLKCLWLESNAITEISGLANQKLLKCLFLHNNLIEKIENLEGCKELDTLNLSHNQVMHVGNCGSDILPVLNTLNLANNCLRTAESIDILRNCNHLSVLDLSNNRLDDILIVKIFAEMQELKVLVLTGNPVVNEIPSYRKTLIVECKKLTYLDTRPVFPRDRACAEAWKRGGFQEERRENIRWNKEERREMLRSVNATLRMRNRGGGEPGVQLIPTDSSDDDEYYSREMRPKKECEDVSSTQQWNILDEMMRNPEAVDNYQNCKVCGSAYCKYQHIENGEVIKDVEMSTDEILESSNFSILWGDDDLGIKKVISNEKLADPSCSYTNDPSEQDNESEIVEEVISSTENISKISAECFVNSTTIDISDNANPEMLNNIVNLNKITICPEDCDSDDDEHDVIKTTDAVNSEVVSIPVNHGIFETLPEHDNIEVMCELLQDFKFDSSSDSIETNLDTSLDCCINIGDTICSFRAKSNKEMENDFTEESFKPTDLSTLWEENSLAELDANDSIDSHEDGETVIVGKLTVEDVDAVIAISSKIIEGATDANITSLGNPKIQEDSKENLENASLALASTNEYDSNENHVDTSITLYSVTVQDSNVNCVDASVDPCSSTNAVTTSSLNIAESDDPRNEEASIALCNLNTEMKCPNNDKSDDPEHEDDSNENNVDVSIGHAGDAIETILGASTALSSANTEIITNANTASLGNLRIENLEDASLALSNTNEYDSNENHVDASITLYSITVEDSNVNCVDASLAPCSSINAETTSSSNIAESDDPGNEDDSKEYLGIEEASIAPCSLNTEEATCPNTAKSDDPGPEVDSSENHVNAPIVDEDDSIETILDVSTILSSTIADINTCPHETDANIVQYSDFIREIDHSIIDDVNITHAVIETIETENSDILLNFSSTIPNIESANQYVEVNLEVPVECNLNTCVFENYKTKSARITNQGNEFLLSRIKRNCFELNELMESKVERNKSANIITMPDDENEPEEYEDVDSSSKIDTLGYSTFVASYEKFFNENEPKSAEFIKTVDSSTLCTEETDNSIDNVQVDEKYDCDAPNVDDIPAMKNFRKYRAHLKSLLHRDSELRISCNELLSEISEKLQAIETINKPPIEDEVSIMDLPINSNNSLLTPSNSFYKICYDDPNSSLEYVSIGNDIEGNNSPGDVDVVAIDETEDDESKDV